MKCAFCGRKADKTDLILIGNYHKTFNDWYCQKSCWEGAGSPPEL